MNPGVAPTETPLTAASRRSPASSDWLSIVKVARPGFWTTSIWFYLLPLGQRHVFGSWTFWLGLFYVTFPLGLLIYGWNDLVDAENDRINPRKGTFLFGARLDEAQLAALPARIFFVQLPFACLFLLLEGPKALGWFAALTLSTAIYNWPPPGFKGRPPLDVLNQAGYLLVFVLSSWLNAVPQLPWQTFVFGALFAMHSHLFGEIMDLEPDRRSGRRTTATIIGAVPAKWLIATFLAAEGILVFAGFRDALIAAFLMLSAGWFVLDAAVIWRARPYRPAEMRFFLLGWNAAAVGSMGWVWYTATLTRSA